MNAIFTINCYKIGSTWYFDDKERNIKKEAFVLGASELITSIVGNRKRKATISFSESFIPEADIRLTCTEKCYPYKATGVFSYLKGKKIPEYKEDKTQQPESGWYVNQDGEKCWLCPAQLKFFNKVADTIYVKKVK